MATEEQTRKLKAPPEYISVISANQCAKIKITDVEAVEQSGRRLHVITPGKDFTFYGDMNVMALSLADRAFYRVMKSLIVNFDHVRDISGNSINFYSGRSINLGRNNVNKTKQAYKRYLMKYPPYSLWEPIKMAPMSVMEGSEKGEKK